VPAAREHQLHEDQREEQEVDGPEAPLPREPLERRVGEAHRIRRVARILDGSALAHGSGDTASAVALELEPFHGCGHAPPIGRA